MANRGYFHIANEAIRSLFMGEGEGLTSDEDMDIAHARAIPITKEVIKKSVQMLDRWKFCRNRKILSPVSRSEALKLRDFTVVSDNENVFRLPSDVLRLIDCYSVNDDGTRGNFLIWGEEYNEVHLMTEERFIVSPEASIYINYLFDPPPQTLEIFFKEWVVLQVIYKLIRDDNHTSEETKKRLVWEIGEAKSRAITMNDRYGLQAVDRRLTERE